MAEAEDKFANNGTEALHMSLCRTEDDADQLDPSESTLLQEFHPLYVYSMFGEAEQIYGYQDLKINLKFASGSMRSYFGLEYSSKIPDTKSVKADDVEGTFYKYLPADYLKNEQDFKQRIKEDRDTFKPVGNIIGSYGRKQIKTSVKGKERKSDRKWEPCAVDDPDAIVYQAYHTTSTTPGWRDFLRRIQILPSLYIEGGTSIDEEDQHWEFVSLFERRTVQEDNETKYIYHFMGYSSLYLFYFHPDQYRMRLSQFIILPPYQRAGHGSKLYALIYLWLKERSDVAELTVEDPSEDFQGLRDKADLQYALSQDIFGDKEAPIDRDWIKKARKQLKLGERQFARVMEILLLLKLEQGDPEKEKAYRLFVKERLFRQNYELLASYDSDERRDALKQTFLSVVEEYGEIISDITAKLLASV